MAKNLLDGADVGTGCVEGCSEGAAWGAGGGALGDASGLERQVYSRLDDGFVEAVTPALFGSAVIVCDQGQLLLPVRRGCG